MNLWQRIKVFFASLGSVTAVPVGHENDGMTFRPAGTSLDKPWPELYQEFTDATEAWRHNPLARRIIGLITSYTVGNGITLHSQYKPLATFVADFWQANNLHLLIDEWSDELARSGELYPVLFTNTVDGRTTIRTVPASLIESIEYHPDDYQTELQYKETTGPGEPPKYWLSKHTADPTQPLMLHYAVNRPIGAIRGESDLTPILPWLRRYSRWLEDRVRLNAAVRAFLWIVHAPARLRSQLEERYSSPPEPGSVIIAEQDAETWQAVTPNLHAADAEKDGRAIRWMIVAGGPGTALLDLGEGEDSNLATGQAMSEQRRRFLRRRQAYLAFLLCDLTICAWERYRTIVPNRYRNITAADLTAQLPDISPEDNNELATAAAHLTNSLHTLAGITGTGPTYRRMALRLFGKFIGEPIADEELNKILEESPNHEQSAAPNPNQQPDTRPEHQWRIVDPREARPVAPPAQNGRTDRTRI